MTALLSTRGPTAPSPIPQTRPLSDPSLQALRWGLVVALTAASAGLASYGTSAFEANVAAQIASGIQPQAFVTAAAAEENDPFLQQKRDAKSEELPAQF